MACEYNDIIDCPCTYPCARHGKCCECVAHHIKSDAFPACFFSEKAEATYGRSFSQLVKDRK